MRGSSDHRHVRIPAAGLIAAASIAALALTSCAQDDSPSPPPTPAIVDPVDQTSAPTDPVADSGQQSATAAPTPTEEPPPTDEPVDTETATAPSASIAPIPDVPTEPPPEAIPDTQAGVDAFARYYIEVWNQAWMTADVALMRELTTENCDVCHEIIDGMEQSGEEGRVASAPAMTIDYTSTTVGPDGYRTLLSIIDGDYAIINDAGETVAGPYEPEQIYVEIRVVETPGVGKQVDFLDRVAL